jgi:hypothetical protein
MHRMNAVIRIILCLGLLASTAVHAQVGTGTPASAQGSQPVPAQAMPWPNRLGMRVAALQQAVPVQDRVVLVSDEATFLDELARWSPNARWPILIEDPVLTPMFLRAFAPKQILRRTDRAPAPLDPEGWRRAIDGAVARAFGGDPATQSPAIAMAAARFSPAGIAAYATGDPARVAAAALAAGRGLVPVSIEGDFGVPNAQLEAGVFGSLARAVLDAFRATGLPFETMGDELDALALCRDAAHSVAFDPAYMTPPQVPGMPAVKLGEPLSLTDALCRGPDGHRYAVCGHIFGSAARTSFAAMCSLFLQRETLWAIDCYGGGDAMLAQYEVASLATPLQEAGFRARTMSGPQAARSAWRDLLMSGFATDMLFLNSSGNADFFDLGVPGRTGAENRGAPGDVPQLTRPLALHMIHSFSLQQPATRETIGGRWLEGGVYAYVGSVHEPYLPAFVPPARVLDGLANAVPFAVAARVWDGPFERPWRITVLGDPLMLCAAPRGLPAGKRLPPVPAVPDQLDVLANCRALLTRAKGDRSGESSMLAMQELALAGQDRTAVQFWALCATQPWAARVAPHALEPLFASRDMESYLRAFALTASPTPRQRDMLWQLWGDHLDRVKDGERLALFERSVRPTWPSADLERLVGPLAAAFGQQRAREAVIKVRESTQQPQQRAALDALLGKL